MSFAAIEQASAAASISMLANASASIKSVEVEGIFSNGYSAPDLSGAGFSSREPMFTCLAADAAGVVDKESIAVTHQGVTTTYKVAEIEPDGTGLTTLVLKK